MMELDLLTTVKEVGFPIAVVAWLLYERKSILNQLIATVNTNTMTIQELTLYLKGMKRDE